MEDKQLERLYDYTKFHMGIYLSSAGGLATLIVAAVASQSAKDFLQEIIGWHWALAISFILMFGSGVSGGVIATSTIQCTNYREFMDKPQGAYGFNPFLGKTWIAIEHGCFWLSLIFLLASILSSSSVRDWVIN